MPTLDDRLTDYLLECFDTDELRRFARNLPDGDALSRRLPDRTATPWLVASTLVALLKQSKLLQADEFWERWLAERPRRANEIRALRVEIEIVVDPRPPPPPSPPSPRKLRILLVSASPIPGAKMRVDEEFARIDDALRHRKSKLDIEKCTAVTYARLQQALYDYKPHVLHISSHGVDGLLYFHADSGVGNQQVPAASLLSLLVVRHDLRLIVFNACESLSIARAVVESPRTRVPWAIGMRDPILDIDSIKYAVSFYGALAEGESLRVAHEVACGRLHVNPRADGTKPAEIPQIVPDNLDRADQVILAPSPER